MVMEKTKNTVKIKSRNRKKNVPRLRSTEPSDQGNISSSSEGCVRVWEARWVMEMNQDEKEEKPGLTPPLTTEREER